MTAAVKESETINWVPITIALVGSFMAILNGSIVNVAIPAMMTAFGVTQESIEWVLTGYMLSLAIVMAVTGYFGDTFGYKKVLITALFLFLVGSVLSGMAWNIPTLVAARVIQAMGGGVMQPISMTLIYRNTPRSKIGTVLGVWGIAAMSAPAIGPTLGGYLVDQISWRMIFYVNVPVALIDLFLAVNYLEETKPIRGEKFDKWGLLLSSCGLFCLLLALSKAATEGWSSPFIVSLLSISAVALGLFVIVELKHPEPMIELRLFKNPIFTLSIIITSIISIGLFGAIFLMPIYLQTVLGVSAMKSGLITMPSAIAMSIMMPIAGRIFDKHGARLIAVPGLLIITVTTYMMHKFDLMTPFGWIIWLLTVRGIGMGLTTMPVTTAGTNTVPLPLIGRASSLGNVIRQVAASFGIAMFTTILTRRQAFHFAHLAEGINFTGTQAAPLWSWASQLAVSQGLTLSAAQAIAVATVTKKIALTALSQGITDCYIIATVLTCLALILCLFLNEKKKGTPLARKQ